MSASATPCCARSHGSPCVKGTLTPTPIVKAKLTPDRDAFRAGPYYTATRGQEEGANHGIEELIAAEACRRTGAS